MISYSDLFRVSLRQMTRQKSYGVIFSIALGITAFIALSVLGEQIRYKIGQDMVLMGGVNVMRITPDNEQRGEYPYREFYSETIEAIKKLPGVEGVSVSSRNAKWFYVSNIRGGVYHSLIYGVDDLFVPTFSADVIAGRALSAEDISERKRVCVLGKYAANWLFGNPKNAVGKLIFLGVDPFEVIGVITGVMLGDWSEAGFIPYTTLVDRNWGDGKITRLFVRAIAWEDVPHLEKEIPAVVRKYQDLPWLEVRTRQDQLSRLQITFKWVQALLWLGIAASLMLGGFGIWYGTFAAVRARTREVGLKKAMGGSDADIMSQFLCEALCKSVAGGVLGIALGLLSVFIGIYFLRTALPLVELVLSCLGSIFFSAVIGVAGGIYPAIQASRMDVVSALRFE